MIRGNEPAARPKNKQIHRLHRLCRFHTTECRCRGEAYLSRLRRRRLPQNARTTSRSPLHSGRERQRLCGTGGSSTSDKSYGATHRTRNFHHRGAESTEKDIIHRLHRFHRLPQNASVGERQLFCEAVVRSGMPLPRRGDRQVAHEKTGTGSRAKRSACPPFLRHPRISLECDR